jgi:hypothetical protein
MAIIDKDNQIKELQEPTEKNMLKMSMYMSYNVSVSMHLQLK